MLSARIVYDYLTASIKSLIMPPRNEHSFEEWGVRNLGRTLYDLCFGIYSERVWGLPTSQISSKQAQRVAKLNLKNVMLQVVWNQGGSRDLLHEVHVPAQGHQRAVREHGRRVPRARATACISSHPWCASSVTASGSRELCIPTAATSARSSVMGGLHAAASGNLSA